MEEDKITFTCLGPEERDRRTKKKKKERERETIHMIR